jgi:FMN-dependent NADH-azoreductase
MNTLLINANPDYTGKAHYSVQMTDYFIRKFHEKFPEEKLQVRYLAAEHVPRATQDELLGLWGKQMAGQPLTEKEEAINRQHTALLDEFLAFHRIVIATPLHNFNVPSLLKDYMDNILVARKTFRYVSGGSVGLMTDDRRVLLLQASGSVYTNNDRFTPLEFSRMYLNEMFTNIMGFDSFQIVRAQGTSTRAWDPEKSMADVYAQMDKAFDSFYA